jgi:hypothetical protein
MTDQEMPDVDYNTAFIPYAIEMGFFVRNWNNLHGELCKMFCVLTKSKVSAAVWHAVPHDRTQRAMLLAAAEALYASEHKVRQEIKWLVDRTDEMGDQRDSVVHAPLAILHTDTFEYFPHWISGHGRAVKLQKSLKGRKLLDELKRYRDKAGLLCNYAINIITCINVRQCDEQFLIDTFLQRPELPSAQDLRAHQAQSRSSHSKKHRRQPESSQE